jgi:methionyl-tRNA formyltransferase
MDATPYLNQMTFNTDIEKTEAEIKVLQKKLELLKEIEAHKSQPKMTLENKGAELRVLLDRLDSFVTVVDPLKDSCFALGGPKLLGAIPGKPG